mmetsp:Transcript_1385/g.3586  ORF Transcript_1385/g.3586 Transcript_1385/m.3586 type:complete len:199 (-) Transcript_1385:209-805(-)
MKSMMSHRRNSLDNEIGDLSSWPVGGFVRVGVAVILLDDHGRVLVGKRIGSHGAGKMALPGGHIELGETFAGCAMREVFEETGMHIAPPTHVYTTNDLMPAEQKHYVTIFMLAHAPRGVEPKNCEPHKNEGWSWKSWSELKMLPADQLFVPLRNLLKSPNFVPPGGRSSSQPWQLAAASILLTAAFGIGLSLGRARRL